MTVLWVALGAAVGAPLRYLTDVALRAAAGDRFPWGTLAVNVIGSFVLGVVAAPGTLARLPEGPAAGLGAGFCGALTTFSTFGSEVYYLAGRGQRLAAGAYLGLSVLLGVGAASLGWWLGDG